MKARTNGQKLADKRRRSLADAHMDRFVQQSQLFFAAFGQVMGDALRHQGAHIAQATNAAIKKAEGSK